MTHQAVRRFATQYARDRKRNAHDVQASAVSALHAWAWACKALGVAVPNWQLPPPIRLIPSLVMREFAEHLRKERGNPEVSINKKLTHVAMLSRYLQERRRAWRNIELGVIDDFLVGCAERFARGTTADIASSLRGFLRFLQRSGRLKAELGPAVIAPVVRRFERPRRALPWSDVQKLLRSVDQSSAIGIRDHAMLLLMVTYGLGAGELIRLRLDDIDWSGGKVHVVRPKTGVAIELPLLPAIARVLVRYLRKGRPAHTPTRHLFVQMRIPHAPFDSSGALRHVLNKHAKRAGIGATPLGAHVLRHSHASRQMELGTPPKVVGDILGHRDPESLSAYVRIATDRLRAVSLPIPR